MESNVQVRVQWLLRLPLRWSVCRTQGLGILFARARLCEEFEAGAECPPLHVLWRVLPKYFVQVVLVVVDGFRSLQCWRLLRGDLVSACLFALLNLMEQAWSSLLRRLLVVGVAPVALYLLSSLNEDGGSRRGERLTLGSPCRR